MERDELKWFVFASIISAENDELEEDVKQDIMQRYRKWDENPNWDYILEPIENVDHREKLIKLLKDEID